jgi:glycosyltransferase involved in cell wall biosynthesis
MPSISIIIATSDRLPALRDTLLSLGMVLVPDDFSVELVLVENGSRQGAEELLRLLPPDRFSVQYLFVPLAGKSRALNVAIPKAKGDLLMFTDDDVRFPSNWIADMCRPLIGGEGAVVVGGARIAPELERPWMTRYHRGFLASTEYLSDTDPSEFAGLNFACLRSVFVKVQGFDSELGGGGLGNAEDCLLARQLKQAGLKFVSRTNVLVEHHPDESRLLYGNWKRTAAANGRSQAYLMHHWYHQNMRWVRLRLLYFRLKLWFRSLFRSSSPLEAEGIPAWELSYRTDIAKFEHYQVERLRPRNYACQGLGKLKHDH